MHKVRLCCNEVFRYAIVSRRAEYNTAFDLTTACATPKKTSSPFLTAKELLSFIKDLTGLTGSMITKSTTQLIMHTGVRTQEPRFTRWKDINFKKLLWETPLK